MWYPAHHCPRLILLLQHTSYLVQMRDVVQLPVLGMRGEQLTSVWTLTMQQRQKHKKRCELSVLDAVEMCMSPNDLCVVLCLEGYGHKPEPQ